MTSKLAAREALWAALAEARTVMESAHGHKGETEKMLELAETADTKVKGLDDLLNKVSNHFHSLVQSLDLTNQGAVGSPAKPSQPPGQGGTATAPQDPVTNAQMTFEAIGVLRESLNQAKLVSAGVAKRADVLDDAAILLHKEADQARADLLRAIDLAAFALAPDKDDDDDHDDDDD